MEFFMPTRIINQHNAVQMNQGIFKEFGTKALIITGQNSARITGALEDVVRSLDALKCEYIIYDHIEENPGLHLIQEAAAIGRREQVEYIIGIGGGSPLDAAKAIGFLVSNPFADISELFTSGEYLFPNVICIPTTAGTGSEVTPYAILTDHQEKTKRNIAHRIFPKVALLDPSYLCSMNKTIRIATTFDALSHMIESILSAKSDAISKQIAIEGLGLFNQFKLKLNDEKLELFTYNQMLMASMLGGVAISQTGTSLPHGMSYSLTYYHNIPHGYAVMSFMPAFLKAFEDKNLVKEVLNIMGFENIESFSIFLSHYMAPISVTSEQIEEYAKVLYENKNKLANHPYVISEDTIKGIFYSSLQC